MIKAIKLILVIPFAIGFGIVLLAVTLWMNVFTIPFLLLALLFCTLTKMTKPRLHFYGFMLYPTWSDRPATLRRTIAEWNHQRSANINMRRRNQFEVTRPWEARFFD